MNICMLLDDILAKTKSYIIFLCKSFKYTYNIFLNNFRYVALFDTGDI